MGSPHHRPVRPLTAGYRTPLFLMLLVTARCVQAQPSPSSDRNNDPYFTNANFNPSMAIVIVVLISAFFFLGFFSIYIRQCTGASADRNSVRGLAAAARSRRQRGLDQEVLSTFPPSSTPRSRSTRSARARSSARSASASSRTTRPSASSPSATTSSTPTASTPGSPPTSPAPSAAPTSSPTPTTPSKKTLTLTRRSPDPVVPAAAAGADAPSSAEHVIAVDQAEDADAQRDQEQADLERIINIKRAKSRARPVKFPRSHSTGHSLVQPGENLDRFTLRLPANVRKEIVAAGAANLQRTRSLLVPVGEGSSRRGLRKGEGGKGAPAGLAGRSSSAGRTGGRRSS
ncbi:putative RING zinc finger domain superfamily protein precursor [Iris pallida]|uniref:RING zinc finger domain superfamily protein n=1 Tax=Iris pallida TaxID=29817 RepID=A0AAX6DJ11_IRIPA|nr:putative RING zinc finger domain superfamily protein precursor [Iris pallida]